MFTYELTKLLSHLNYKDLITNSILLYNNPPKVKLVIEIFKKYFSIKKNFAFIIINNSKNKHKEYSTSYSNLYY